MPTSPSDRTIIRDLAKRIADIAADPVIPLRRNAWIEHNSLRSAYPMILIFPEGGWTEILPDCTIRCSDKSLRTTEQNMRRIIYTFEHFCDDTVVNDVWKIGPHFSHTSWGLEPRRISQTADRGSWHIDPVVRDPSDLAKLRHPDVIFDEKATLETLQARRDLFGDILPVLQTGIQHISYHLMSQYTKLRGLEEAMVDMYAEPNLIHDAMTFFEEGHRRILRQYTDLNLLSFNNDNTYHSSGGNGWTDQLPLPDADRAHVRPSDMWASAEAQELAQVSPEHHAEFSLAYENRLLQPFGLNGYGCCEDLTRKLPIVFTIPNIRRISISPWANVDRCAEQLKGNYIFSWKPNPAHLVGDFNRNAVRAHIRHTVEVARQHDCCLEMILKDTHTCDNHPERFDEWTRIAREVVAEIWGPAPWSAAPSNIR